MVDLDGGLFVLEVEKNVLIYIFMKVENFIVENI